MGLAHGGHTPGGARTVASLWGHARKLGTQPWSRRGHPRGHDARWSTGDESALCAHCHIMLGARHTPDWRGAEPCCPVLASDPAGSLPGWGWHWQPPGVTVGPVWDGKGSAGGAFASAQMLQVALEQLQADAVAPGCGSAGGSTASSQLGARLSRQDAALLKASDKLLMAASRAILCARQKAKCCRRGPLCVGLQAGLALPGSPGHR